MSEKRMTWDEWEDKAVELYGDEQDEWQFQCPRCGNVQSVESVKEDVDLSTDDIRRWINKACQGRFSASGCDWKLGMIDQYYGVIVEDEEGKEYKSFAFADQDVDSGGPGMMLLNR